MHRWSRSESSASSGRSRQTFSLLADGETGEGFVYGGREDWGETVLGMELYTGKYYRIMCCTFSYLYFAPSPPPAARCSACAASPSPRRPTSGLARLAPRRCTTAPPPTRSASPTRTPPPHSRQTPPTAGGLHRSRRRRTDCLLAARRRCCASREPRLSSRLHAVSRRERAAARARLISSNLR